jgi:RNA polymerase sigma-70 factor (ECF subfamily)
MRWQLGEIVWQDFPISLHEARLEAQQERHNGPLSAREKLFAPVEKAFRQWVLRNYGHDPFILDARRSDVFQQVYLCAWRSFEQFKGNSDKEFVAWILKIFNNELNQILRWGQQQRNFFSQKGSAADVETPAATRNVLEQLIEREEWTMAREAFERLPKEYREILVLRYENHLAYEEIAARMHSSPGAVRMLCSRAKHMWGRLAGIEKA